MMKSKKIVITRSVHQAVVLADLLRDYGAEPLFYPCIEIVPQKATKDLDSALKKADCGSFDWIVFTSVNTVFAISERLRKLGISASRLGQAKIAAIGPATSAAICNDLKLQVDLMPGDYLAEAMVDALLPVSGKQILLPQSNIARPVLYEKLTAAGAEVLAITAYQTKIGKGGFDLSSGLAKNGIDAITFTSSSSVGYFMERLKLVGKDLEHLENICIACLGPITAETAKQIGLSVSVHSSENSMKNLVIKLEEYFSKKNDKLNHDQRIFKYTTS